MLIEKRKKGEKTWEEISLVQMVDEIEEFWTVQILSGKVSISERLTEQKILYVALIIALTRKYETTDAEYRII